MLITTKMSMRIGEFQVWSKPQLIAIQIIERQTVRVFSNYTYFNYFIYLGLKQIVL